MSVATDLVTPVAEAIEELVDAAYTISYEPLSDGGAIVTAHEFAFGDLWTPTGDLRFELAYNYPYSAIYPFFGPAGLQRVDGGPRPNALTDIAWRGSSHTQISLRHNRWNPRVDTALGALAQVEHWFQSGSW